MSKDKSPWKSTAKIETVEVPVDGEFTPGSTVTVYGLTDDLAAMDAAIETAIGSLTELQACRAIYRAGMAAGMRRAAEIVVEYPFSHPARAIRERADALEGKK